MAGFAALPEPQRVEVMVMLRGAPLYESEMEKMAASNVAFADSEELIRRRTAAATRANALQNQVMFTTRRLMFYSTMTAGALGAAVGILGFKYLNTFQQVQVAIKPFLQGTGQSIDYVTNQLFRLAALTPFTFQQVARAFQMMFVGMRGLGVNATETITTLGHLIDALAVGGTLTEQSLLRVANAIQDMGYQGTLTGKIVSRLANIGIPIRDILTKELGLTGEQIANIKAQGISALQVMHAIDHYLGHQRGFSNAALRMQTQTLHGAWTTFVDFLSQASAKAQSGIFTGIQQTLANVDKALNRMSKAGEPITLTKVAELFDKQLSPSTHLIMRLFTFLEGIIKGLVGSFKLLLTAVSNLLKPFDTLTGMLGDNYWATTILGYAVGILTAAWIVGKGAAFAYTVATALATVGLNAMRIATLLLAGTQGLSFLISRIMATIIALVLMGTAEGGGAIGGVIGAMISLFRLIKQRGIIGAFATLIYSAATAMWNLVAATWAENAALYADPLVWIAIGIAAITVGLVILYFKWKSFHDLVNRTYNWLKNHPIAALLIPIYGQIIYAVLAAQKLFNILRKIWNFLHHPFGGGGWLDKIRHVADFTTGMFNPFQQAGRLGVPVPKYLAHPLLIGTDHRGRRNTNQRQAVGSTLSPANAGDIVTLPANAQTMTGAGGLANLTGLAMPDQNIKVVLRVDGKDLAEVVAKHRQDRQARR